MAHTENKWPKLGCGLGLRTVHYETVTKHWPKNVDWFEVISENYMDSGGRPLEILEKMREHYPIALHGVSLSIGSADPLKKDYLKRLKTLADRVKPAIVSDHLCWTGVERKNLHDLLPLPYTEEAVKHVIRRVKQVQDFLGRKILLENVSTYFTYRHSRLAEWDFLAAIAKGSGCGLLVDVNNIYVNAKNHGFDARKFLEAIPAEYVGQFHLAGHTDMGDYLFDTHSKPVIDEVWDLYRFALDRFGNVSTLIEWDEDIPPFEKMTEELSKARKIYTANLTGPARHKASASPSSNPADACGRARRDLWRAANAPRAVTRQIREPKLSALQKSMKKCVLPSLRTKKNESAFGQNLNKQGRTPGVKRIAVYADGYVARMHEALVEAYPAVRRVWGEAQFPHLAERYAEAFPSEEYSLSRAGRHFPAFLAKEVKKLPFLSDLARLEWRLTESFHVFQDAPADLETLKKLPPEKWERLRFSFQPSVSLIRSRWPVFDIWNARNEPEGRIQVDLKNRPQNVLIYRQGFRVRCAALDGDQARLFSLLASGQTLGSALQAFSKTASPAPVGVWFSQWASLGLIQKFF